MRRACGRGCFGGGVSPRRLPMGKSGMGGGVRDRENSAIFSAKSQALSTRSLAVAREMAEGGPAVSLRGRQIGNNFIIKDGWRRYHGDKIPGFLAHPHRGFETVTVVQ